MEAGQTDLQAFFICVAESRWQNQVSMQIYLTLLQLRLERLLLKTYKFFTNQPQPQLLAIMAAPAKDQAVQLSSDDGGKEPHPEPEPKVQDATPSPPPTLVESTTSDDEKLVVEKPTPIGPPLVVEKPTPRGPEFKMQSATDSAEVTEDEDSEISFSDSNDSSERADEEQKKNEFVEWTLQASMDSMQMQTDAQQAFIACRSNLNDMRKIIHKIIRQMIKMDNQDDDNRPKLTKYIEQKERLKHCATRNKNILISLQAKADNMLIELMHSNNDRKIAWAQTLFAKVIGQIRVQISEIGLCFCSDSNPISHELLKSLHSFEFAPCRGR